MHGKNGQVDSVFLLRLWPWSLYVCTCVCIHVFIHSLFIYSFIYLHISWITQLTFIECFLSGRCALVSGYSLLLLLFSHSSHVWLFVTQWTVARQAPLSSPSPPPLNLSQHQGLFKWVSSLHQEAKVLKFQLQHQSLQWTPKTDLFRVDWLDLLAVQGTLKSLI